MKRIITVLILLAFGAGRAGATEPNESFAEATILPAGTFSVIDSLAVTVATFPDTMLGSIDFLGGIDQISDDDGPYEAEGGSALYFIDTNSGFIEFAVTGYPDTGFGGGHSESGYYEVFVDVFDFFGDHLESFSEVQFLDSGEVQEFSYYDDAWLSGSYDVYTAPIEDVIGDIDFFTFTGLTAGSSFNIQTIDTDNENIDTYLGWFDGSGELIEANDDIDYEAGIYQSMLSGVVPANGQLTFAVTGFGDESFLGEHGVAGNYELQLDIEAAVLPGDYNSDGSVDAADYVVFRKGGLTSGTYATWRTNFGEPSGGGSLASVPEPTAAWTILAPAFATLIYCVDARNRTTAGARRAT